MVICYTCEFAAPSDKVPIPKDTGISECPRCGRPLASAETPRWLAWPLVRETLALCRSLFRDKLKQAGPTR